MHGKKAEEQMLNKEFQKAYLIFENNPSQENKATLNVRSRARWHDLWHGEKHSKYISIFFGKTKLFK